MRVSFWLRAVVVPLGAIGAIAFTIHRALVSPAPAMISAAAITTALAAFAILAALASLTRGWLQNGFVVLATLCLGLAGLEAYASSGTSTVVASTKPSLFALDPVLGARPAGPGTYPATKAVGGKVIYDVAYTIDAERRRQTISKDGAPRVVFFGDSWTFGEGLPDAQTLPQIFADITGANVLNYGMEGASPAFMLRAMETGLFDKDIKGARLFILQTAPFHIPRTACRYTWNNGSPRYISRAGIATYYSPCKARWWRSTGTFKMLFEPFAERITGDDVETYLDVVDRIAEIVRDTYHVPLLIIDDSWLQGYLAESKLGFTTKDIQARFKATGAMVIDNETEEKNLDLLELPNDFHPTPLANRLIAKKIVATLAAEKPKLLDGMSGVAAKRPDASTAAQAQPD